MGRKAAAKGHHPPPPAPARGGKSSQPVLLGAVVVGLVAASVIAFRGGADSAPEPPAVPAAGPAASAQSSPPAQTAAPGASVIARVEALAKLGPRKQASLPPIPFQAYAPPRRRDVIVAAYQFAAEHPEVLAYVPCFCGCEQAGHRGNHDCFVRQRAANGDVVAWDEHGVECAVCIDVASRLRQMHASGASVRDIRAAVDQEFGSRSPVSTPTPHPPGHSR